MYYGYNKQFVEAANLRGIACTFHQVDTETYTDLADKHYTYKGPIVMNILFEENPKARFLESLGWLPEGDKNMPKLIWLPVLGPDLEPLKVSQGAIVDIYNEALEQEVKFMVEDIRGPLKRTYFLAKLTPFRPMDTEMEDGDNSWLGKF